MNKQPPSQGQKTSIFIDTESLLNRDRSRLSVSIDRLLLTAIKDRSLHRATAYVAITDQAPTPTSLDGKGVRIVLTPDDTIVDIVVDILLAAPHNEVLVVVSNDNRLVPAVTAAQHLGARIEILSHGRKPSELAAAADSWQQIGRSSTSSSVPKRSVKPKRRSSAASPSSSNRTRRTITKARPTRERKEWPTAPPPPPPPGYRKPKRDTTAKRNEAAGPNEQIENKEGKASSNKPSVTTVDKPTPNKVSPGTNSGGSPESPTVLDGESLSSSSTNDR